MTNELPIRAIHDLERAIRLWELLRDNAQLVVDEARACSEKHENSVATNQAVAKAGACIATCNRSILEAKARIDELIRGD